MGLFNLIATIVITICLAFNLFKKANYNLNTDNRHKIEFMVSTGFCILLFAYNIYIIIKSIYYNFTGEIFFDYSDIFRHIGYEWADIIYFIIYIVSAVLIIIYFINSLTGNKPTQFKNNNICLYCGSKNQTFSSFCKKCGRPLMQIKDNIDIFKYIVISCIIVQIISILIRKTFLIEITPNTINFGLILLAIYTYHFDYSGLDYTFSLICNYAIMILCISRLLITLIFGVRVRLIELIQYFINYDYSYFDYDELLSTLCYLTIVIVYAIGCYVSFRNINYLHNKQSENKYNRYY